MNKGRYRLGQEVPLGVLCLNSSGVPVFPDACPSLDLYGPGGKKISGRALPVLDRLATTGLFAGSVYLDETYTVGDYTVVYRWDVSGVRGSAMDSFRIVAGGDGSGQVIALFDYERPQADHLIQQRTGGSIYKGRNPRVGP